MNNLRIFVADEELSSQDEPKIYPVLNNEHLAFYTKEDGNKYLYRWCAVTGKEPITVKEISSSKKIGSILFEEDFAVIEEQKVQGLPRQKCYQLIVCNQSGQYEDVTDSLCRAYKSVCNGFRCVITEITRNGDIYLIHFRAKGFDRSQHFQKIGGELIRVTGAKARSVSREHRFNELAERLCRSAGTPIKF